MFILTHAYIALRVVRKKLSQHDKDLLLAGSILPDVSDVGIADEQRTHTEGIKFLNYLDKDHKYAGIGAVIHGEKPKGLDYYTHNGFYTDGKNTPFPKITKNSGYLTKKYKEIAPICKKYKKSLGKLSLQDAVHLITEFCCDHLIAQQHPQLARDVHHALTNSMRSHGLINFANYFEIDDRQLRRLKRVITSDHVRTLLNNFQTAHGTAHNFQNFLFLKSIREKNGRHKHRFVFQISKFTHSSLGFLQTKLRDRSLVQLFERCIEIVRKDFDEFLLNTEKKITEMAKKERLL